MYLQWAQGENAAGVLILGTATIANTVPCASHNALIEILDLCQEEMARREKDFIWINEIYNKRAIY